jgi:hypothetical protein
VRPFALAALAVALTGCGSASSSSGSATVWVTRDRGAVVVRTATVPTGESAMQGLDRIAEVRTRFGGRYVREVDGVAEQGPRAWFYYVNGYLADRSASAYRLRAGDVVWWDYRSWRDPLDDAIVAGAFPEPLLHGYDGRRRSVVVRSADRRLGRALARLVHGRAAVSAPADANVVDVVSSPQPRIRVALRRPGAGSPVRFVVAAPFARRLLATPTLARYRYAVP